MVSLEVTEKTQRKNYYTFLNKLVISHLSCVKGRTIESYSFPSFQKEAIYQLWCCKSLILTFERWRQGDQEFKAMLSYIKESEPT